MSHRLGSPLAPELADGWWALPRAGALTPSLSGITSRPPCYPASFQAVRLRRCHRDGVNRGPLLCRALGLFGDDDPHEEVDHQAGPPSRASTTNSTRISVASVLKYWTRPPHTPAACGWFGCGTACGSGPWRRLSRGWLRGRLTVLEAISAGRWPHPYHRSEAERRALARSGRSRRYGVSWIPGAVPGFVRAPGPVGHRPRAARGGQSC